MLTSSLLPQHDLAELGRLPRLLEHYHQHRAAGTIQTFRQFLALHYGPTGRRSHTAGHAPEHEGLPLHDCHHAPAPAICALPALVPAAPRVFRTWPARVFRPAGLLRCAGGYAPASWQPPCA